MNRIFKVVWNRALGKPVVTSEAARSFGKSSTERLQLAPLVAIDGSAPAGRLRPLAVAIGLAAAGVIPVAIAQEASYTNLEVTDTAILSALQVGGAATFTGTLSIGGVNVGDAISDLTSQANTNAGNINDLDGRVDTAESNITTLQGDVSANAGNITDLDGRVDTAESNITTLQGDVSANTGDIAALDTRVTDAEDDIVGIYESLDTLGVNEGNPGIKYFRANSNVADARALGNESIAIGPNAVSGGDSSFAAGDGAATTETAKGAIALGQGAIAGTEGGAVPDGDGSIAIGRNSQASGNSTVALGDGANIDSEYIENATALGAGATVSGNFGSGGTAVGADAVASAGNATALGTEAKASGSGSIAVGQAEATAGNSIAAGTGAYAATGDSIALGTGAGVGTEGLPGGDRTDHIAIGTAAGQNVQGNQSTAIGYGAGQDVVGDGNVALGVEAGRGLEGNNNISIGVNANDSAGDRAQAIAIGDGTAAGSDSVALGSGATAAGSETVALGKDSIAGANGVALGAHSEAEGSNIALGRNSAARESDVAGVGYLTGEAAPGSAVSVGNSNPGEAFQRRITNVSDGAQRYDAVNVGQLQGAQNAVANLVGGNVTVESNGSFGGYVIELEDLDGGRHQYTTVAAAINAVTSGAISVLPGDAVIYNPNGTVTVAQGVVGTDAVNVEQLNEAIAESGVKYFSANTTVDANRGNDGATADNAMAIGPAAVASGTSSLAVGHAARVNADAHNGVAIGHDVSARAENATVLGNRSHSYGAGGVAIGQQAVSRGENSIVMGTGAEADPKSGDTVDNAIVIGTAAEATADDGIAIGQSALASEDRAVAQGFDAHAEAVDSQAFGTRAHTSGVNSQASGTDARASGANAIATGTNSRGYATDGIAMGTDAISGFVVNIPGDAPRNHGSIAIGDTSRADDLNAMALGVEAQARAESATAIGDSAVATADAEDGLAVGSSARVTAQNASAFGRGAEATAEDALAAGSGATASGSDASAFGSGATASGAGSLASGAGATASAANASAIGQGANAMHEGSVALGAGSETAGVVRTSEETIDGNTYQYAGATDGVTSTVSVGQEGAERTITNVAAGRVNADSTDAINGSQLYGTNMAVESLADDLDDAGQSVADALGGTSSYNPESHTVTAGLSVQGNNYTNVQDALTYVGQGWNVSAEGGAVANVAPGGSVNFSSDDENIVVSRDGTNLVFDLDDELTIGESITFVDGDTFIDGDSVTTTNLTVGGETRLGDSFVVNNDGDVTYNNAEIATQADGLSFAGNTGGTIDKALGDDTPLTISGGLAASEASTGANLRVDSDGNQLNLVMARDLTDLDSITINDGGPVINVDGINMNDNRITNLARGVDGTDAVNVDQLGDVEEIASRGWDISTNGGDSENVAPGGSVDFSDDGNVLVSNEVDADGNHTVNVGLADDIAVDSVALNGTDGTDGLTMRGGDGAPGLDGTDGITRIIYEDADGNPHEVATMDDGLVFAGNTGDNLARTLGETLTISGELDTDEEDVTGANLRVDSDGDQLNLVMAQDLTDLNSIAINDGPVIDSDGVTIGDVNLGDTGLVIVDGPSVTADGIDAGGEHITNVARGENGTDAVNVDQLGEVSDVANLGWNVSANGGDSENVAPGGSVDFSDDGNVLVSNEVDADGNHTVNVGLADDIAVDSVALNGTDGADGLTIRSGDGSPGTPGLDGTGGITRIIYEDADGNPHEVATMDDGLVFAGNTGEDIAKKLGETLIISGALDEGEDATGANLRVDSDGNQLNLVMARDLTDLDSITINDGGPVIDSDGVTIGDVNLGDTGLVIVDGPSVTTGGIDAGDERITNVAPGVDGTDAVNVDQLGDVEEIASRGWNISADGDDSTNVAPGDTVDFGNTDDNIEVSRTDDGLSFNLAENIDLGEDGSVATGDTVMNNDGVQVGGHGSPNDPSTTVGAGNIEVAGSGATPNTIIINGESGDITGLTNVDLDDDAFASAGRAATEEQLSIVNDAATAGWTLTDAEDNDVNIGPNGVVTFEGDDNISVAQIGEDQDGVIEVALNRDLELDSVTTGDTVMSDGGVQVGGHVSSNDPRTSIGAGVIEVAGSGATPNTIVISGEAGTIGGLSNTEFDPEATYEGGLAATQEQLSQVSGDLTTAGLDFVGDDNQVVHRNLGEQLSITGGATGALTEGNIGVSQNGDGDGLIIELAENVDLGEDGSIDIGDGTDGSTLDAEGLLVADGDNSTTVGAGLVSVTEGDNTTTIGGSVVSVGGDSPIVISGDTGTIEGLTNTDLDGSDFAQVGRAATEEQLSQVNNELIGTGLNFVGDDGQVVHRDLGQTLSVTGGADLGALSEGNIGVTQDEDGGLFIELAENVDLGEDGSVTTGNTVVNNDGLVVNDNTGNPTATTTVEAGTITVWANPTTGSANTITIDANTGTIGGLTNRTWDPDNFTNGQAATEDQLGSVYEVANAGWHVTVDGENATDENNVGPEGVVDFSNEDGNILIDRDGTDLAFNLNPDLDLGEEGSLTTGNTVVNNDGVNIGDGEVVLGEDGLVIAGGPTVTTDGIAAGSVRIDLGNQDANGLTRIYGVGAGTVSETSTDAINGSQLWAVQNIAEAGWNLSGSGENAVNIGPNGAVDFRGDSNITVSQTGDEQEGVIEVALNDSITLGEGDNAVTVDGENGLVSVGDTIMNGEGVSVGDDVQLNSEGLVIADGPSVTIHGIDAGGMQITNVASGLGGQSLDQISGADLLNAVNVGDLQGVASDLGEGIAAAKTEVEAGDNINVSERTGDNGQTIYTVETQRDVNFDSIEVGTVNIDHENVDENGNTLITGVGRGEISETSTDAVNGSQLWEVNQELGDINQSLDGGMNFAADQGDDVNRRLGDTVAITGDNNITTQTSDNGVQVTLNSDLNVDSVTTGNTTVNNRGVTIQGGPSMTVDGIDGGGKRITNVAPGVDDMDAVNLGQMRDLSQRFENEIGGVHNRIGKVERNANAGTASALAAGTVPQAWIPGKSMVGVGAGTYEGESAISVGVSRLSDNGRWIIQGRVTGDSQNNFGAGIGAGWHW